MEQSFESALNRLSEISDAMMEPMPLAESLEAFKEAAELILYCDKTLKEAELVVEEYKKKISGGADLERTE